MTHNTGLPWTPAEDAYMRKYFTECGAARIATELGRSRLSVQQRALALQLPPPKGKHPWRRYPKPPPPPA